MNELSSVVECVVELVLKEDDRDVLCMTIFDVQEYVDSIAELEFIYCKEIISQCRSSTM